MSFAFDRMANVVASTKRSPALSLGKRGSPTVYLASLSVTPIDPLDPNLRNRLALESPHELLQSFVGGNPDIKEGDVLVVGSSEYPIKAVADWAWEGDDVFLVLVLEGLKR